MLKADLMHGDLAIHRLKVHFTGLCVRVSWQFSLAIAVLLTYILRTLFKPSRILFPVSRLQVPLRLDNSICIASSILFLVAFSLAAVLISREVLANDALFHLYLPDPVVCEPLLAEGVDEDGAGGRSQDDGHDRHGEDDVAVFLVEGPIFITDTTQGSSCVENDASDGGLDGGLGDPGEGKERALTSCETLISAGDEEGAEPTHREAPAEDEDRLPEQVYFDAIHEDGSAH